MSAMEVDGDVPRVRKLYARKAVLCETPGSIVYTADRDDAKAGTPATVVVKKIKITDEGCFDRFDQELEIMLRLNEANILRPLAVCESPPNYAYILPWMRHGSFYELMHIRLIPIHKRLELVVLYALDLARAVAALHKAGIIHRDIKPHNLLLGDDAVARLTDFGIAEYEKKLLEIGNTVLKPNRPSAGFKKIMGTFEYMAPELFQKHHHTRECDVYALGISMNELYTGQLPYMGAEKDTENFYTVVDTRYDRLSLMKAIATQSLRPDIVNPRGGKHSPTDEALHSLMKACWAEDAKKRPSSANVAKELEKIAQGLGLDVKMDRTTMFEDCIKAAPKIEAPRQYVKPRAPELPELKLDEKKNNGVDLSKLPPLEVHGGVISTKGKRGYMEDYYIVRHYLFGRKDCHLFGVFDGHGGAGCAEFVCKNLEEHLKPLKTGNKDPAAALKQAFQLLNEEFLKSPAFEEDMSGTTALVCLIVGRKLYVANAGDSMVVMARGKKAVALNKMHLASDSDEREWIESRGGFVKLTPDGKLRTNGVIQLSRAIGDRKIAKYITADPEVKIYDIVQEDEFMVLASDGLWDALSPQKTVDILQNTVKHMDYGSKSIVSEALQLGSDDNITSIVVYFTKDAGSEANILAADSSVEKLKQGALASERGPVGESTHWA